MAAGFGFTVGSDLGARVDHGPDDGGQFAAVKSMTTL